jgi:antitoxin component YwqK of YwqJK toxin-antitoxin module
MNESHIVDISKIMDEAQNTRLDFRSSSHAGWIPHGRYSGVDKAGRVVLEITYSHGLADGPYIDYWSNGKVACEGRYKDGMQHGLWHYYHKDGLLNEVIEFDMGKDISELGV